MKAATRAIDLSGLDGFDVGSLMTAGMPEHKDTTGKPMEIPLNLIIEDPNQPRTDDNPGFSQESLGELAESIKQSRGVKVPISVQPINAEGKYVINHGARRFRASKIANMPTIKAFVDDAHDDYDQAVENIQRENFTPMEVALFISKREGLGESRVFIAGRLGKSKGFVTQHAALLAMPDELRALYDNGACRDVLALYELTNLHKKSPDAVLDFLAGNNEISRASIEGLKGSLKEPKGPQDGANESGAEQGAEVVAKPQKIASSKAVKPSIMVKWQEKLYVLKPEQRPSALHLGWIEDSNSGVMTEVELSDLVIDSIV